MAVQAAWPRTVGPLLLALQASTPGGRCRVAWPRCVCTAHAVTCATCALV